MKVVSENSEAEVRRVRAGQQIEWPLKELAANIIRVTRGAGRAYDIPGQMIKVLEAFETYREDVGHYPSDAEISEAINIRYSSAETHSDQISYAVDEMVQGSLQIAASQLLGQSTQKTAGRRELFRGIDYLEQAREENRKRYFGTPAEKAQIAEQDRISEELASRVADLASNKAKKKPR